MDNEIIKKVTLVIPTYNRPRELLRLLSYYDLNNFQSPIIILDSSLGDNKEKCEEIVSLFSALKIQYLSGFAPEGILAKIRCGVKCVNTEYMVFCADDDFVTMDGIYQSVRFLKQNPDYTVAQGYSVSFHVEDTSDNGPQFIHAISESRPSLSSSDVVSRLRTHLINYSATFHGVHKTNFVDFILEEADNYTDDLRFVELLPSMLTAVYGKIKRLDKLYMVREESPTSTGQSCKSINDYIREGTYDDMYGRFRHCIVSHLLIKSSLTEQEIKKIVDESMYLYRIVKMELRHQREKLKLLSIYDKLFLPGEKVKQQLIRSLEDPSSKYYKELDDIRKHVLLHHRENIESQDVAAVYE